MLTHVLRLGPHQKWGNIMSTYTFYIHTICGDIATLDDLRLDYESMDVASWHHGKPAEECNREN